MRDRYLFAGMLLLLVVFILSFNLPKASNMKIELGNDMILGFAGMNIAKNPSFEKGEEGPQGWEPVLWHGSASFLWLNSTDNVKTGNRSLMIQSNSSDVSCAWQSSGFEEMIDAKPGLRYDANVWAKIERVGFRGVYLVLAWFDAEGKRISDSISEIIRNQTEGWREIWVSDISPQNAKKSSIELHLNDEGIVFFDDVHLEELVPDFYASNDWLYMRKGLLFPSVEIQNSILTISARFISYEDESIIFQRKIEIDTLDYPFLTLSWRTSTNRPGDPGIFLGFVTASGRTIIQPLGLSKEWTTSTIHLYSLTQEEFITGVRFMLDDWDDSLSSGLFSIQIREVHFSPRTDLRNISLLVVAGAVFALTIIDSYERKNKLNKAILVMANIAFMSMLPSLVLPFFELPGIEMIPLVGIVITFGLTLLKRKMKANELARTNNAQMMSYIALLFGLLTIPWLAFLLRLSYATMPTAFGDETSYGIMSWGILKGKFVGLYFPGPWLQQNVPSFFSIEEYPRDLPLPYTMDWMTNLKIVSPFFLPYLCPIISAPLIAFFGFSEITIRFAYVLMSTTSVLFTFLIGRHFSNRIGLIAAGTLAGLSFSANYGSRAFMDNGVLLFLAVTALLYLRFKQTSKRKYLYLGAISAGFCALTKLVIGFLALQFLILALFFDLRKRGEIIKILLISLGIFSIFIISSLLVSYQALIWSLLYFAWYMPALAVQGGQAWMAEPLMLLNYPELVLGLFCLVYVLRGKDDFTKFVKLLLLSVIELIMFAKPWWLLPILPLLSLSIAKAFSHGGNGDEIIVKSSFLLIFAALTTKHLPVVREFSMVFFGLLLVFSIITHFTTSLRFDFLKNKDRFNMIWTTFIIVLLATLYIQDILIMPLY